MLKKLILVAAGLALSAPALADHKHHWKHHHHYTHHYSRPVVVMPAPRVYYAPPPPVVYYAPPAPVYYAPPPAYRAPVPHSGVSIRLHFPL